MSPVVTDLLTAQAALLRAEQQRVAELAKTNQALKNSIDYLATTPDLNAFLGRVLLEVARQLDTDDGILQFYNPRSHTLATEMVFKQGQVQLKHQFQDISPFAQPIPADSTPIWELMQQTKQPFVINTENAAQYMFSGTYNWQIQHWVVEQGIQSGINILLTLGDDPIGLLTLFSKQHSRFRPEELELAQALAHQATLAIQLTRLAEEAKQAAIFEERNRMAREIHDSLAQVFTSILVRLQTAQLSLQDNPTEAQTYLEQTSDLARQGLGEARRSVHALRPQALEGGDLAGALSHCLHQITHGTSVHASFHQTGQSYRLPDQLQLELFRIGQEAITNACKHAHPTKIRVELSFLPQQIQLAIQDNGQGFILADPLQSKGFGLIGMHERAQIVGGKLTISSQPQQGTHVLVTVEVDRAVTE